MGPISYNQVEELRAALDRHQLVYLFIGKTGPILHGFPDTTQDADLFVRKTQENGSALTRALRDLGFAITEDQAREIERGKDFQRYLQERGLPKARRLPMLQGEKHSDPRARGYTR